MKNITNTLAFSVSRLDRRYIQFALLLLTLGLLVIGAGAPAGGGGIGGGG